MSSRSLCGGLVLLFLIASISAAYCEKCTAGGCDSVAMVHGASTESVARNDMASGHCPQEQPASEDPLTCRSVLSWGAVEGCCAMSVAMESGEIALLSLGASFDFGIRPASAIDGPTVRPDEGDGRWPQPSARPLPQSLQPLFALHSSFLI